MKFLKLIPVIFISLGIFSHTNTVCADGDDPNNYKILSTTNKKLSITNVETLLREGDNLIKSGEIEKAKDSLALSNSPFLIKISPFSKKIRTFLIERFLFEFVRTL